MSGGARHLYRSLGAGLLMRPPRPEETEELVAFVFDAFSEASGAPDETAAIWARDLLRGDHPTSHPADGTVVVDTVRHRIAACCFLIRQTWSYAGIPFAVGRPELIATGPDYRGQGLAGAQLAAAHAHSEALGDVVQAITGIPWFYRQFGYEPAIISGLLPVGDPATIPARPVNTLEPFPIRVATVDDAPFIARLYEHALARVQVGALRDEAIWRYELSGRTPGSDYWHEHRIIESPTGAPVGFFSFCAELRDGALACTVCELDDGVAWEEVTPGVLRALRAAGAAMAADTGARFDRVLLDWTPDHPLALAAGFPAVPEEPFAWYVRVPDVPAFLHRIAPALEANLAASACAGFSGEVRIASYPNGLRLAFADGRLTEAEALPALSHRRAEAALPGRTFLQLLFGARSLAELAHAFPFEAWARTTETEALLTALFPRRPSAIWPIA